MRRWFRTDWLQSAAAIAASALLAALYVRGGAAWLLGFVMLVPWLSALNVKRSLRFTLASAYGMTLAYTAAVFPWFGIALGRYTQHGAAVGLAVLLLAAPLFQPQLLVFALVRQVCAGRHGPLLCALAAAAAWVATESLLPKLLGDTLGHGLYPSLVMRQGAAVGGAAGLTLLLLLTNQALAIALARWRDRWRLLLPPLTLAALGPLLLAGYGLLALADSGSNNHSPNKPLRVGLVQANLADYEGQRRLHGTYAVVSQLISTHFAMSYDAVVRRHADVVLWSETAYPTTFGHPKSAAGAAFDRAIMDTIDVAGVPFVFGTYDSDADGEYNAAALVQPGTGLTGMYRKTRLFPLTEYVPAWLDGARLRQLLPWSGNWRAGNGARVFPLRLADGRELIVLPLICLDDVDPSLAINGARLGAQAILTMSNDGWFISVPDGARLHQAVAAFRSIETGLPQWRVTSTGYSAAFDPYGSVLAGTRIGEAALVVAELPLSQQRTAPTLMVRWGDWVGPTAGAGLLWLAASTLLSRRRPAALSAVAQTAPLHWPVMLALLPPTARLAVALLRSFARLSLLGIAVLLLANDGLRSNTLAQIRLVAGLWLAPELAAWCVLRAFAAQASVHEGELVLSRGAQRIVLALSEIAAVELWRWPLPCAGLDLRLCSGRRWRYGLALAHYPAQPLALRLAAALGMDSAPAMTGMARYTEALLRARRCWLDRSWIKFGLLPLLLALPAFHLHQHIAYGSAFGEYFSFGLKAYLLALVLWWAAWAIGVLLCATTLRAAVELLTLLVAWLWPSQLSAVRVALERCAHGALYLGLPGWLLARLL